MKTNRFGGAGVFACAGQTEMHVPPPGGGEVMPKFHSTTILAVRHQGRVAIGGDGQVTLGNVVMKSDAHKLRKLLQGKVIVGFAGAAADAFALMERFEAKLNDFQGSISRPAVELANECRTDRIPRPLAAMPAAVAPDHSRP